MEGRGTDQVAYTYISDSVYVDLSTGFTANSYYNEETNTLVIAYAGTDPSSPADLIADASIAAGEIPEQGLQAVSYANQQISDFENAGYSNFNVVYTGHSLGGFLAQYANLTIGGGSVVAFNSPGYTFGMTVIGGIPGEDILYVFSDPAEWGAAGIIHTLGEYGANISYVSGTEGHSMLLLRDALDKPETLILSEEQLVEYWADRIKTGSIDVSDFLKTIPGGSLSKIAIDAVIASGEGYFLVGTQITMSDGATKPIELIKVGDDVISILGASGSGKITL